MDVSYSGGGFPGRAENSREEKQSGGTHCTGQSLVHVCCHCMDDPFSKHLTIICVGHYGLKGCRTCIFVTVML